MWLVSLAVYVVMASVEKMSIPSAEAHMRAVSAKMAAA